MAIDLDAPIRFLRTQFMPDDWVAILLKSHDTGGTAERVGPVSLIANPKFQAWLRAENARRFSVFVSVNAIRPQRRARTREAIGEIRHVFLDADRDGPAVLAAIAARRDLPSPGCVVHTSPNRLHVLWRVSRFTKEGVESLQKQLAGELGTDRAATSCAQVTRMPGFVNYKYRPGALVKASYANGANRLAAQFPGTSIPDRASQGPIRHEPWRQRSAEVRERARRYIAAIPPAVAGRTAIMRPSAFAVGWCAASTLTTPPPWRFWRIGIGPANRLGLTTICKPSFRRHGGTAESLSAAF